jgi:NAD(P)-dependent dehydrogenase (short-subunit alcohol dehydrogenase family)
VLRLDEKVVIITGGASGLGKTICEVFGKAGASLVLLDKNELTSNQTQRELIAQGFQCTYFKTDVTIGTEVKAVLDKVIAHYGKIDILVNSAGGISQGIITEISDHEWEEMLDTHLKSVFLTCRSVVPHMLERGKGKIINIASVEAKQGHSFAGLHYSAAKGGVMAFTRQLALQVSPLGIHVNCVAPGVLEEEIQKRSEVKRTDITRLRSEIPLGRLTKSSDVAYAVSFLASSMADFLTGETVDVNGGKYLS